MASKSETEHEENTTAHDIATLDPEPNSHDVDSGSDGEDGVLTLDTNMQHAHSNEDDAEDVVAISIGQAQTYFKSPTTPAAVKARALESSHDYFGADALQHDYSDLDGAAESQTRPGRSSPPKGVRVKPSTEAIGHEPPLPWKAEVGREKRSGTTRSVLGQSLEGARRRASSGSSAIGKNLRKMIPDVSSFFPPNLPAFAGLGARFQEPADKDQANQHQSQGLAITRSREANDSPVRRELPSSQSKTQDENARRLSRSLSCRERQRSIPSSRAAERVTEDSNPPELSKKPTLQQSVSALLSPAESANSRRLRHSTSDSSLFLRRSSTTGSRAAYDDTNMFADVSSQVNSRFKAITDSLQDSNFRLPKMPSVSFASMKNLPFDWANSELRSGRPRVSANEPAVQAKDAQPDKEPGSGGTRPIHRAHPIISEALSKATGDILVLGGYRGSVLRSAEPPHRQLWVPVKVGLNIRKVDLEVGLADEDEERMKEKIFSSGVLSHIGPVDICRRLLRHLRKCPNAKSGKLRVHDYGYDWRLSPELLSRRLIEYLETLKCNQPNIPKKERGAYIIAHSLGGLITRYAVNKRPELFAGVVYAGVPQTCVNILGPLRNGDDVLLSSRVLTAQTNFSFRTSFALLPEDGRCFLNKHTGERYDVDFFKPETYDEYRLTPCINPALPAIPPQPRKSLVVALSGAVSDTISGSLPSRRSSWFGGGVRTRSPTPDSRASPESAKGTTKDPVHEVADDLSKAEDKVVNAGNLEPSMQSSPSAGKSLFSSSNNNNNSSVSTHVTIPKEVAFEYLSRTLASVLAFKKGLPFIPAHQESNAYPPVAFMFGKSVPTVYGARVVSREAIKYSDAYDDLVFAAGDGVVLASAAQLPKGYRCVKEGRVETDRGHVGLLGDLEGVGKALGAIVDARMKGVGLGKGF